MNDRRRIDAPDGIPLMIRAPSVVEAMEDARARFRQLYPDREPGDVLHVGLDVLPTYEVVIEDRGARREGAR